MKDVLLCDANFCVLPIVEFIMSQHYHLSVVGSLTTDPAHFIADESIPINYSDVELLYEHIKREKYNYLVPGCNDRAYLSLAYIAEKLQYPGYDNYETVLTIHHKDKFRLFAEKHNYPIPKAVHNIEELNKLSFPILIKPVDSFSGKGIVKIENFDNLKQAWKEAEKFSSNGLVVAEEYIEGKLYSHSAFIKNGEIIVDFFVNEYCTVYPYQVNSSNVSSLLSKKIQGKVKKWTEKFAKDLNLVDGLVHTQFISDNEKFFLIEVARRCPGDLYSKLIQKSTGIEYAELYSMPFLGLELPDNIVKKEQKFISRHTVSVDEDCIFISSGINLENKNIQNVQLKCSGEKMKAAPFDKSGILFIEHTTAKKMEDLTEQLKEYIQIEKFDVKGR